MSGHPMKIPLIEDNRADARLIREMLVGTGAELSLDVAERLSAGLERLHEGRIDVVLLEQGLLDGPVDLDRVYTMEFLQSIYGDEP